MGTTGAAGTNKERGMLMLRKENNSLSNDARKRSQNAAQRTSVGINSFRTNTVSAIPAEGFGGGKNKNTAPLPICTPLHHRPTNPLLCPCLATGADLTNWVSLSHKMDCISCSFDFFQAQDSSYSPPPPQSWAVHLQ